MAQKAQLDSQITGMQATEVKVGNEVKVKVATIGNIVHASVPTSNTEDDNQQIRTWHPEGPNAQVKKQEGILSHHEVMYKLDILDQDRGERTGRMGEAWRGNALPLSHSVPRSCKVTDM